MPSFPKQTIVNRETILRLIEEVLRESNAHTCCKDGYCSDNLCVVHNREGVKNIVTSGADRVTAGVGIGSQAFDVALARMIDHTLLKPDATVKEIEKLCSEARQFGFASVCVNPSYVSLCAKLLKDTAVKVCTVIGFPLGATTTETKVFETEQATGEGAHEVDMVINVGRLKSADYDYVENDIRQVAKAAHRAGAILKVILETGLLTDEEKIKGCLLSKRGGADFVKTSTGFTKGGATVGDVALMKKVVGTKLGVKASGGIRTHEDAVALVAGGADRIGASASVKIVTGETVGASATY
jgi:deoxyribose-phosphate aldolase